MRVAVMTAPGEVRVEDRPEPAIVEPMDAIVRLAATCIPAPVRRFLPELIDLIWNHRIDPGNVLDLAMPLDQAAAGYQSHGLPPRPSRSYCAHDPGVQSTLRRTTKRTV